MWSPGGPVSRRPRSTGSSRPRTTWWPPMCGKLGYRRWFGRRRSPRPATIARDRSWPGGVRRAGQAGRPENCRGCPFLMALTEFPDPELAAHREAVALKAWVRDRFGELAADLGRPAVGDRLVAGDGGGLRVRAGARGRRPGARCPRSRGGADRVTDEAHSRRVRRMRVRSARSAVAERGRRSRSASASRAARMAVGDVGAGLGEPDQGGPPVVRDPGWRSTSPRSCQRVDHLGGRAGRDAQLLGQLATAASGRAGPARRAPGTAPG